MKGGEEGQGETRGHWGSRGPCKLLWRRIITAGIGCQWPSIASGVLVGGVSVFQVYCILLESRVKFMVMVSPQQFPYSYKLMWSWFRYNVLLWSRVFDKEVYNDADEA